MGQALKAIKAMDGKPVRGATLGVRLRENFDVIQSPEISQFSGAGKCFVITVYRLN